MSGRRFTLLLLGVTLLMVGLVTAGRFLTPADTLGPLRQARLYFPAQAGDEPLAPPRVRAPEWFPGPMR